MRITATLLAATALLAPSMALSDEYMIDPAHTLVTFQLDHLGFAKSIGWFGEVTGTISYVADDVTASSVTASIATASVNTNHDERDGWIKSNNVLNAAVNPAITFASTGIEQTSERTGTITGELTMNGQTLPVTLEATFNALGTNPISNKETLGISATAVLTRSAWGVTAFVGALGDQVSVQIELEAIKVDG
ncbi:MAG: YceI family protein [Pseudomonadota bacterium]